MCSTERESGNICRYQMEEVMISLFTWRKLLFGQASIQTQCLHVKPNGSILEISEDTWSQNPVAFNQQGRLFTVQSFAGSGLVWGVFLWGRKPCKNIRERVVGLLLVRMDLLQPTWASKGEVGQDQRRYRGDCKLVSSYQGNQFDSKGNWVNGCKARWNRPGVNLWTENSYHVEPSIDNLHWSKYRVVTTNSLKVGGMKSTNTGQVRTITEVIVAPGD